MAATILGMAGGAVLGMAGEKRRQNLKREADDAKLMDEMYIKHFQEHPEAALSKKATAQAEKHFGKDVWSQMYPFFQVNAAEWQQSQQRKIDQFNAMKDNPMAQQVVAALQQQIKDAQNLDLKLPANMGADPATGGNPLAQVLQMATKGAGGLENFVRHQFGGSPAAPAGAPPTATAGTVPTAAPTATAGQPAAPTPPAPIAAPASPPGPAMAVAPAPTPAAPAPAPPAPATGGGPASAPAASAAPDHAARYQQYAEMADAMRATGDADGAKLYDDMAKSEQTAASMQRADESRVKLTADQLFARGVSQKDIAEYENTWPNVSPAVQNRIDTAKSPSERASEVSASATRTASADYRAAQLEASRNSRIATLTTSLSKTMDPAIANSVAGKLVTGKSLSPVELREMRKSNPAWGHAVTGWTAMNKDIANSKSPAETQGLVDVSNREMARAVAEAGYPPSVADDFTYVMVPKTSLPPTGIVDKVTKVFALPGDKVAMTRSAASDLGIAAPGATSASGGATPPPGARSVIRDSTGKVTGYRMSDGTIKRTGAGGAGGAAGTVAGR